MKIIITESQFLRIKEQRGGHNKRTTDEFINLAKDIHSDENGNPIYDYSETEYINSKVKVKIFCPKHGVYFDVYPNKHLQGQGCKYHYIEEKQKYSDQELEDEAKKYNTTAEFKKNSFLHFNAAQKRGKKFYDEITSHFLPEKESAGEKLVANILVNLGLIDESCLKSKKCPNREFVFEDCVGKRCRPLKFDFYIPEENTVIEYDGEQHFKESSKFGKTKFETTKHNDILKNEYCLKNNINLIRIHHKVSITDIKNEIVKALENPKPITLIGPY